MKKFEFVGGQTCPESVPIKGLIRAAKRVLTRRGKQLVSYPFQTDQHGELLQISSSRFKHREGISLPAKNTIITTGSKEAISLVVLALAQSEDTIITEELTYMGSLRCFRDFGLRIEAIPLDMNEGMDVEALESTLKGLAKRNIRPRFVYTIPNHHNPTGAILSLSRRRGLLELAQEYNIAILEDDCYGDVDLESEPVPPSLYTLSDAQPVFFTASFSKILAPGVRLGYLCIPDRFLDQIKKLQKDLSGGPSALSSFIVAEYLRDNLRNQIVKQNTIIRQKRDAVLDALEKNLSGRAEWNRPRGGLFIWIKLPETVNMQKLQELAEQHGVSYTPGREFHAHNEDIKYLRLSYAHMSYSDIRKGIALLARCVKEAS